MRDLEGFIETVQTLMDGERVPVQFFQLSDINKISVAIVQVDRRWHEFSLAVRNDKTGFWDYEIMPNCVGVAKYSPQTARTLELDKSYGILEFM